MDFQRWNSIGAKFHLIPLGIGEHPFGFSSQNGVRQLRLRADEQVMGASRGQIVPQKPYVSDRIILQCGDRDRVFTQFRGGPCVRRIDDVIGRGEEIVGRRIDGKIIVRCCTDR